MKENFEINLVSREDMGKGASRRLRHAGLVPGIIYGGGKDPEMVTTKHNELILHLENEAFYSHILTANVEGGSAQKVVLKDLQRHPAKPFVMHFDLLRVADTDVIKMHVPLHFEGEETAPGIKTGGGNLIHAVTDLEISCEARNLPEYITVDISAMELGDTLHLSDISLPEGVSIVALIHGDDHDAPVVSIQAKKGGGDSAEAEAAAEDAEEGGEE
ncbi:MAG: 50S ribosomal protein L25/general stress protein Ctc [bacterium]